MLDSQCFFSEITFLPEGDFLSFDAFQTSGRSVGLVELIKTSMKNEGSGKDGVGGPASTIHRCRCSIRILNRSFFSAVPWGVSSALSLVQTVTSPSGGGVGVGGVGRTISTTVDSLRPHVQYKARVAAENALGKGQPCEQILVSRVVLKMGRFGNALLRPLRLHSIPTSRRAARRKTCS